MKKLGIKNRFDILIGFGVIGIVLMIIIPVSYTHLDAADE